MMARNLFGDLMPLLSDSDSRAVDLLLNRRKPTAADGDEKPTAALDDGELQARLAKVGDLLSLLKELPAEDPPMDLVGKTMERIEHAPPSPELRLPGGDQPQA